jgi:nucleoside-diphosphate-sugar epimerase
MAADKAIGKIYVAGHRGMVGSAIVRQLESVIASPSTSSGQAKARQSMPP